MLACYHTTKTWGVFKMTKPIGFRVNKEQEKIVKRFRNALIRKYGQVYGVFSNEIVELMRNSLESPAGQHAHTKSPSKFTCFHHRLAAIYFKLPNGGVFGYNTVERLIEKYAGGDDRTMRRYFNALKAWELVIPLGLKQYERGNLSEANEWIKEAYASDGGAG